MKIAKSTRVHIELEPHEARYLARFLQLGFITDEIPTDSQVDFHENLFQGLKEVTS